MGAPCERRAERQEMIAALEDAGYDMLADAPADWRFSKTDQELSDLVEAFTEADDASAFPDISELVEAIRETVDAGDAYIAAHPDDFATHPDSDAGKRWSAALDRLRAILSDCEKAMEAFGS
ncbi:MAG: hypothetical protein WBA36_03660 [Mesorhizobium sp.]